jgi:hypothetical protein
MIKTCGLGTQDDNKHSQRLGEAKGTCLWYKQLLLENQVDTQLIKERTDVSIKASVAKDFQGIQWEASGRHMCNNKDDFNTI